MKEDKKLTEEQKIVVDVLTQFKSYILIIAASTGKRNRDIERVIDDIERVIDDIERKYELKPKYMTLREYLKQHEAGAYHTFEFVMPYYNDKISVSVDGIWDFERIYQPGLLDMFYVISDNAKDNGGNCENYHCTHKLELKMIDKE